jgi:hypothetical protein
MKVLEKNLVFSSIDCLNGYKVFFQNLCKLLKKWEHVLFKEFGLIVKAKTNLEVNNLPLLTITPHTNTLNAKENNLMLSFDV